MTKYHDMIRPTPCPGPVNRVVQFRVDPSHNPRHLASLEQWEEASSRHGIAHELDNEGLPHWSFCGNTMLDQIVQMFVMSLSPGLQISQACLLENRDGIRQGFLLEIRDRFRRRFPHQSRDGIMQRWVFTPDIPLNPTSAEHFPGMSLSVQGEL